MAFKSFCGSLSLQAGVVILAMALIQIAIVIIVANIHEFPAFPTSLIFVIVFVLVLLIVGVVMISAAYKEKRQLCLVALLLLVILIILFLVGSILSFSNQKSLTDFVCVGNRCPETLWCASLSYRKRGKVVEHTGEVEYDYENMEQRRWDNRHIQQPIEELEEPYYRRRRQDDLFNNKTKLDSINESRVFQKRQEKDLSTSSTLGSMMTSTTDPPGDIENSTTADPDYYPDYRNNDETKDEEYTGYTIGLAFIAAVVLFLINIIFFVFCAIIVFSYSKELKYMFKV